MTSRFSIGNVISRSLSIYTANFVPFILIALIIQAPMIIYGFMATADPFAADFLIQSQEASPFKPLLESLVSMVLANIVTGAIIFGVFQQLQGERVDMSTCVTVGLKRVLPVVGVGLIFGICVVLGMVLLIIPGIILFCMLLLAVPVAVVEGGGVGNALRRSATLTQGFRWSILGIFAIIYAILMVLTMIVTMVGMSSGFTVLLVGLQGVSLICGTWISVATAVTYHDIRASKENVDTRQLAEVFA